MGREGDLLVSDTPITVPEFVRVRQHISNLLKENSQTQAPTRIRQAENLLMAGVIDVESVLKSFEPKPAPVEIDAQQAIADAEDEE